jgi:glycosyltransferase involved in cell wall biosynthesis
MADIPITVLMPVYNAGIYLAKSIDTILGQTYRDFEFLIIDDGSTDSSSEILHSYRDSRIRIIRQENQGVAAALHLGVDLSQGEYIVRMDADDESTPDRLEIQKKTMDRNPQVVLCYGLHDLMDEQGHFLRTCQKNDFSNVVTKWLLIWNNILTHPTVMIRKKTLQENNLNYRLETNGAEDFDLWNRLSFYGDFLFIPQVLLRYRLRPGSVNRVNLGERQFRGYSIVIQENFKKFGLPISPELADELVVISGQTPRNPITYSYRFLPEVLLVLSEDLAQRFSERMSVELNEILPILAGQMVRWARFLLHHSKKSSFNLLKNAFRLNRQLTLNHIFLLTLFALLLPQRTLKRINIKRSRPLI